MLGSVRHLFSTWQQKLGYERRSSACTRRKRGLLSSETSARWRAPQRWLFLPSSNSAGSPEDEEKVESPPRDKGKGKAPAQGTGPGEVTGVICDLCNKKGIPCRWGKVSFPIFFYRTLLTFLYRRQPAFGPAWAASKPGPSPRLEVHGPFHGSR